MEKAEKMGMENDSLDEKRAKLKAWLALHRLSRKEFSEKIGMSVTSINGWFSNTNIPDKKWEEVKALFEEPENPSPVYHAVAVAIPEDLNEQFKKAAELKGMTLEEFLKWAALDISARIIRGDQ